MRPELMLNYSVDAATFSSLIAFYYYIYSPMQLFVGVLMDRYGPKRLLSFASFICATGTCMFVATKSIFIAQIGRLIIGFGSSFAFVGVLKIASLWLPKDKFAVISGATMALGMLGGLLGDTLVTYLITQEGWQLASYHTAAVGFILSFLLYIFLKGGSSNPSKRVVEDSTFGEVFLGLRKLLANPQAWLIGVVGCFMWFPISMYAEAWGVGHMQEVFGYSAKSSSFAIGLVFLGMACGGPLAGIMSDYLKSRRIVIAAGAISALTITCLLIYSDIYFSYNEVCFLCFTLGLTNSPQVLVFPMSKEITDKRTVATAVSFTNMLVMFAGIMQPMVGYALRFVGPVKFIGGTPIYSAYAYKIALLFMPLSFVLSLFILLFIVETY